jgi:DNA-binding beta-propeller fold protein YncE
MLPQLGKLESEFPDELVVVGVHSAKFPGERPGGSLRSAVQRNRIEHPVVNDRDFQIWQEYSVRAWPTLMFVDPSGMVIGKHEGEAPADALIAAVRDLVSQYDQYGMIDRSPIDALEQDRIPETSLAFPGKVLADETSGSLFISDSGHDRVIVSSFSGEIQHTIGTGERGYADGPFGEARFWQPQGMALHGQTLYIADTGNGAVRAADLASNHVRTVAGTGEQGLGMPDVGPALEVDLRSPWDLAIFEGFLYIAMAGTHQIWRLNLNGGDIEPYAGDGVESIRDGVRQRAWLAQPSGLAVELHRLYFADSETSAVRYVELPPGDQVRTLVGTGLFDFGDVDGVGDQARLQHPIGVAVHNGIVYVADSYNHKIKRLYPDERRVETWLGTGEHGLEDDTGVFAAFDEPSGLSIAGDRLYIADTNNHAIRVADLATGEVTTIDIQLPVED